MLYLKFQNPGVCPTECFTILGVSTTRFSGIENTIGQFGSGTKHAVNLLLRNNINPVIFCGNLRLEFYVEPTTINDGLIGHTYGLVCYRVSGKDAEGRQIKRTEKTSLTIEHGIDDWNDISMALREFTANCIDRDVRETGGWDNVIVEVVPENKVRAKSNETRVYIPLTPEVSKFHSELGKRFLHFSEANTLRKGVKILPKSNRNIAAGGGPVIYKNGVLVREINSDSLPSMFDYNLGDELKLDESRNVDDDRVRTAIAKLWAGASPGELGLVLTKLHKGEAFWEGELDSYILSDTWNVESDEVDKRKLSWQTAFSTIAGEAGVLTGGDPFAVEMLIRKGFKPFSIGHNRWLKAARVYGVKSEDQVLTGDEVDGKTIYEANTTVLEVVDDVWQFIELLEMTNGKAKPKAALFSKIMQEGCQTWGYYRDNTVFVHKDMSQNKNDFLWKVVLEEIVHHVSSAQDCSRDIQDFCFRMITQARRLV